MITTDEIKKAEYIGNGKTTSFPVSFQFLAFSSTKNNGQALPNFAELQVKKVEVATGTETLIHRDFVLPPDYSATEYYTLNYNPATREGTVILSQALTSDYHIVISRDPSYTQLTKFISGHGLEYSEIWVSISDTSVSLDNIKAFENALDGLTILNQELAISLQKTLRPNESVPYIVCDIGTPKANALFKWDGTGTILQTAYLGTPGSLTNADYTDLVAGTNTTKSVLPVDLAKTLQNWPNIRAATSTDVGDSKTASVTTTPPITAHLTGEIVSFIENVSLGVAGNYQLRRDGLAIKDIVDFEGRILYTGIKEIRSGDFLFCYYDGARYRTFAGVEKKSTHGSIVLDVPNNTTVSISPLKDTGGDIVIDGVLRRLQLVAYGNVSGLSADTNYFVYAYFNPAVKPYGGDIVLELSRTPRQLRRGVWIKQDDPTRTFVGIVRAASATTLYTEKYLRASYFNRQAAGLTTTYNSDLSVTSTTPAAFSTNVTQSVVALNGDTLVSEFFSGLGVSVAATCKLSWAQANQGRQNMAILTSGSPQVTRISSMIKVTDESSIQTIQLLGSSNTGTFTLRGALNPIELNTHIVSGM